MTYVNLNFIKYKVIIGTGANAIETNDLKVVFEITKTSVSAPNWGVVKIYNLKKDFVESLDSLSSTEKNGLRVSIIAGFRDSFGEIFSGVSTQVLGQGVLMVNGRETYVQMLVQDGIQYTTKTFVKNFTSPYTDAQIIENLGNFLTQFNDFKGIKSTLTEEMSKKTHQKPLTISQTVGVYLDELTATYNGSWYVDNGILYIFNTNNPPNANDVTTLQDNDIIDITPIQYFTGQVLEVKVFLNPSFRVGSKVNLQSRFIPLSPLSLYSQSSTQNGTMGTRSGIYYVLRVVHRGDSYGSGDWFTTVLLSQTYSPLLGSST